jgi:glycosyltransferase involved in cell wall biosynthesis
VLASSLGGNGELVGTIGERWLAPPGDVAAWAAAIGRLAGDEADGEVDDAGGRCRALYEERFTPKAAVHALESAYAVAMGANPRARTG